MYFSLKDGRGFLESESGRIYYESKGSGHTVVLLHSGLIDSRMWDHQFDSFSSKYHAVRYDQRGFGRSDPPSKQYSQVDDLHNLFGYLKIDRAALVGLSSGGSIAIDFTLAHPESVDALVLAASALSGYREWKGELREMWGKVEAVVRQGDVERAQELEFQAWVRYGIHPGSDAKIRRLAKENRKIYEVDPELETGVDHPAIDRLSEINIPTLVIVAEKDQPDIEEIAGRLVKGIRNSRMVRIPGTDHFVNMRNPAVFDRVVLEFLEKIGHWPERPAN